MGTAQRLAGNEVSVRPKTAPPASAPAAASCPTEYAASVQAPNTEAERNRSPSGAHSNQKSNTLPPAPTAKNCLTIPPADRTTKSARRTTATLAGRTMNAAQTKQHPQRHRQRGAYRRWLGAHQPDIDQRRHPARDQRKAITNQMGGKKNCSARSTAQNKMATIATCSPEIAIRCAMPVFSISVRKACSSAVRSPNASASNTAL